MSGADEGGPELPPRSRPIVGAAPLLLVGIVFLSLSGALRSGATRVATGAVPLWFLLLGVGAIVLAGGIVALFVVPRATPPRRLPPPVHASSDGRPAVVAWDEAREPTTLPPFRPVVAPSNLPDPPRPSPDVFSTTAAPASTGAATTTAEIHRVLEQLPTDLQKKPTPSVAATPAPTVAPAADARIECATCGRSLPAREGWRRCRECRKPLCASCFTESIRHHGSGYCRGCAATLG